MCSSVSVQCGVKIYIYSVWSIGFYSTFGDCVNTWTVEYRWYMNKNTERCQNDWQGVTKVPREDPRNLKCIKYQTHFWEYVKLCLLAKQAEILCNDTAPSSLIKYFCAGRWRPSISVTRSRRTSVLWITIEMLPLCVPSRATWCHTPSHCCSNHMW